MSLIVGVIDSTTNYVEHPEVVADRIERVARVVDDPHRIMTGTDCGFETTSGMSHVAKELVWEKLRALRRRRPRLEAAVRMTCIASVAAPIL